MTLQDRIENIRPTLQHYTREQIEKFYILELLDWAETDTKVRDLARPLLGDWVDGDTMGAPDVADIVEKLVENIKEAVRRNKVI
jgi:hypothetical protein